MKPKAIKSKHEHEYDAEDVFLNEILANLRISHMDAKNVN